MSSIIFEIDDGTNISRGLFEFARCRGVGICVLGGYGVVSQVTLRQSDERTLILNGRFTILSISGTILPPPTPESAESLTVSVSDTTGQVISGIVVPPLVASGRVVLVAASFSNIARF